MSLLLPNSKIIKTEEEFIKYLLRKLGGLKFSVEIVRDNWDDIIGDTVDVITEHGYDNGFQRGFLPIVLEANVSTYNLSGSGIVGVKKIYTQGNSSFGSSYEGLAMYQSMMGGRTGGNFINISQGNVSGANLGGLADFIINYSNYRTIEQWFKTTYKPRFNENTGVLTIFNPPKQKLNAMMDCFILDPLISLFNNRYFKRIAYYFAIKQWWMNINSKYKFKFSAGETNIDVVLEKAEADYKETIEQLKKSAIHGNFKNTSG